MIDHRYKAQVDQPKFSILIPTWNNLPYLQICLRSIFQNSAFAHQVIIHVNEGSDGTLQWVRENGYSYTHSASNIGVCWSMNAMRSLADAAYLVYMNDDMYVCPGWDTALAEEIASLPDNRFCLSATLLQPRPFWCKSVIAPADFGQDTATFNEAALLKSYLDFPHDDWSGSTWPPVVLHRDVWDLVGGFSVEFSPGMYSDPDLSAKLYMAGVRHFKGVSRSRVYHFEARSTGRVTKNKGTRQFLSKWGITSSTFMKVLLHRGEPFAEREADPGKLRKGRMKGRIKRIFGVFFAGGQAQHLWDKV